MTPTRRWRAAPWRYLGLLADVLALFQDGVVHLLVRRAWPLAAGEHVAAVPSHDFH